MKSTEKVRVQQFRQEILDHLAKFYLPQFNGMKPHIDELFDKFETDLKIN